MKSCLIHTGIIFFLFANAHAQPVSEFDKIDSIAGSHMSLNHIPGMALAIVKNGKIEKRRFYGTADLESNARVHDSTVFEIASMTKQFTCAGILLLQEDGLLSVTDKVSKYLEGLPKTWEGITIEQLMNHTSGLRDDWDEPTSYFLSNNTEEKMLHAQKHYPLLFKPGQGFHYSNGPFILGLVIKEITGKPYARFLKERIFDKLEMSNTGVYDSVSTPANLARGYWWKNGKFEAGVNLPAAARSRADVGIITTLDDMIKWGVALRDNRLLNPESLGSMFSSGRLKSGNTIPYGLGWYHYFFRNQLIYEHGGAFRTGFNTRITRIPNSKMDVIILSNKWEANLSDLSNELVALYDPTFRRISEFTQEKPSSKKRNSETRMLFSNLAVKKFDRGELYRKVNVSGFDPDELKELLKGFKKATCIGTNRYPTKPIVLYGTKVTEVLYYKVLADHTTFWSFAYDNQGKLVAVNLED